MKLRAWRRPSTFSTQVAPWQTESSWVPGRISDISPPFPSVHSVVFTPVFETLLSRIRIIINVCVFIHVWLFATPWTLAHQTLLSMGFPRQEDWSGLLFTSPGDLPHPGIKPVFLLAGGSLPLSHLGSCRIVNRASELKEGQIWNLRDVEDERGRRMKNMKQNLELRGSFRKLAEKDIGDSSSASEILSERVY